MLVLMGLDAPRGDIDRVKERIRENDCTPHEIPGASNLAIGITGPTSLLTEEQFRILPSVRDVIRVTRPYKLVSRMMKSEDTVIHLNGQNIGAKGLMIIAGPCSVESRDQIFDIAGQLKDMGIRFLRAGAYKPRSSPYSFQGLKQKGLSLLSEVKSALGMHIVTEALDQNTLPMVADVADIIQIGARNMQNFALLEQAAKYSKPVLLKRGLSATVEDLLLSAEYIVNQGNYKIILCERGIRTFEKATRNTLDLNAVPVIKRHSHLPVIVDPSHGIGIGDDVPAMALAAVACGADGLMIEVHPDPERALSDGFQSLNPVQFRHLLARVGKLAPIVEREMPCP